MDAKESFEMATTCHIMRCWSPKIQILCEWKLFMEGRGFRQAFRQFTLCGQITGLSPVTNSSRVIVEEFF
jgi:hypothetical protein